MLINPTYNIKQFWIAFEGISGSGKSTIINEVYSVLNPLLDRVTIVTEKTHPLIKDNVFSNLKHSFSSSYLIYYWWLARRDNLDFLKNNNFNCVLYDRYYDSTYVYGPILDSSSILYNFSNVFNKPDVTFYLRLNTLQTAFDRNSIEDSDPYESINLTKLKNYQERYDDLYLNSSYRHYSKNNVHFINAENSISDITSEIIQILRIKYHLMDKDFFNY